MEGKQKELYIDGFDKITKNNTENNPIRLINDIGKWDLQLQINKVNIKLQEDQKQDAKVYEEEEPDRCQHLIDNIEGIHNSVNTLNAKIISTSYWYDLQGNYPTPNKNHQQEKYPVKAIFTVIEKHCSGLSSGNYPKL